MKRQRNRNRNGGGGGGGGGGGKPQHNANRAFESNGPEGVKVRGAAQHVYEKYSQLARDASTSGDRVLAENYLQHAEHYFRTIRSMQPQRPVAEILGRDQYASGFDIDFEDESGAESVEGGDAMEGQAQDGDGEGPRTEARSDFRQNDGRPRDESRDRYDRQDRQDRSDRPERQDRFADRGERPDRYPDRNDRSDRTDRPERNDRPERSERPYVARDGDRPRDDRARDERPRDERPRDERPRDDRRNRDDRRFGRADRADADPLAVVEPDGAPLTAASAVAGPILRADDGEISHAPAFLQARAEPRAEGEERRPRRRRRPAGASEDAGGGSEEG
ncbi:MAG TPA: DUF4167 domain-containing protein [Caulobacteraceae bacterium]|jgi:hypothetical protein|nr:DUF4167 domain-containing protein [Caulobacteraceae bacterium]